MAQHVRWTNKKQNHPPIYPWIALLQKLCGTAPIARVLDLSLTQ